MNANIQHLFASLELRPDATERDVKRAYARQLKTIDPETQQQAFQDLRSTYDALIAFVRHHEALAQPEEANTSESWADAQPALEPRGADEHIATESAVPLAHDHESPAPLPMHTQQLANEVCSEVEHAVHTGSFDESEDVEELLHRYLADPRLDHLEVRQYFEWGLASLLAGGWRHNHEHLFNASAVVFDWQDDRARLNWLGRAGEFMDAALEQRSFFDSQDYDGRAAQRQMIRAMRSDEKPLVNELLAWKNLAPQVARAFPVWLHIISRPTQIEVWKGWQSEVPRWRERLAFFGTASVLRRAGRHRNTSFPRAYWGIGLAFMIIVGGLTRLSQQTPPEPSAQARISYSTPSQTQSLESQLPPSRKLVMPNLQEPAKVDLFSPQSEAAQLAQSTFSDANCSAAESLASALQTQYANAELGPGFDQFIASCARFTMGNISDGSRQIALDRLIPLSGKAGRSGKGTSR